MHTLTQQPQHLHLRINPRNPVTFHPGDGIYAVNTQTGNVPPISSILH